jgi:hypothetical protein
MDVEINVLYIKWQRYYEMNEDKERLDIEVADVCMPK